MKTTETAVTTTLIPHCGMQGNNLVIAPDKGQARFTAWIITRDQEGSETMVSECLEIPLIGIGDTAPPIVLENVVEQFTWINGHPYEGVDYFLQVFAYDDKNVQSSPEEIKLITKTKQTEKSASAPPSVASSKPASTPSPVQAAQENLAPQGWIDWMCKWLQMWVVPVLAQLAEKRPSKKTLREIPQFAQNFNAELNDLRETHPSDPQVKKVCEMYEKFGASVKELQKIWDEQEKQREEAKKAPAPAPIPAPTPAPAPAPVPPTVPVMPTLLPTSATPPLPVKLIAPKKEIGNIWAWLSDAEQALKRGDANGVNIASIRLGDSESDLERVADEYPDTDPTVIKNLGTELKRLQAILTETNNKLEAERKAQKVPAQETPQAQTPPPRTFWQQHGPKVLVGLALVLVIGAAVGGTWFVMRNKVVTPSVPTTTGSADTFLMMSNQLWTALTSRSPQQSGSDVAPSGTNTLGMNANGHGNNVRVNDIKDNKAAVFVIANMSVNGERSARTALEMAQEIAKSLDQTNGWPTGCSNAVVVTVPTDKLSEPQHTPADTMVVPGTVVIVIPPSNSWDVHCIVDPYTSVEILCDGKPITATPGVARNPSRDNKNIGSYWFYLKPGATGATLKVKFTKLP